MPETPPTPDGVTGEPHPGAVKGRDDLGSDPEAAVEAPPAERPDYSVYTTWQKRAIVLAAALGAFLSPFTAQIYFPALNVLASDFGVSDSEVSRSSRAGWIGARLDADCPLLQINLTVTTYMVRGRTAPGAPRPGRLTGHH